MLFPTITILIIIVCALLILIVLVQNSKGGGLSSTFAASNQIMGVRKTTDFLEKATWTLAGTLFVLCIVASMFIPSANTGSQSKLQDKLNTNTETQQVIPTFPGSTSNTGEGTTTFPTNDNTLPGEE